MLPRCMIRSRFSVPNFARTYGRFEADHAG
ncbi:hypothetical protein V475_00810 [Sphingobium baderi LL03]|nr:hypothetical protein V475_00810 [Sphingobium baderi LL03]